MLLAILIILSRFVSIKTEILVISLSFIGKLINNIYLFYFLIFIPIAIIIFKQIKNIAAKDDDEDDGREEKEDKENKKEE